MINRTHPPRTRRFTLIELAEEEQEHTRRFSLIELAEEEQEQE